MSSNPVCSLCWLWTLADTPARTFSVVGCDMIICKVSLCLSNYNLQKFLKHKASRIYGKEPFKIIMIQSISM